MQIFGGRFNFDDSDKPRQHFDSFEQSLLTVFQVKEIKLIFQENKLFPIEYCLIPCSDLNG